MTAVLHRFCASQTVFSRSIGAVRSVAKARLDLGKIVLNNIRFSVLKNKSYLPARIDGAAINGRQFIFEGHTITLYTAGYSPDGKKILSASRDKTIKEWKEATGEPIQEFQNEMGLLVHGLDFRNLHPRSRFTKEEKTKLRRFGAIFDDKDERIWKESLEDAYGGEDG